MIKEILIYITILIYLNFRTYADFQIQEIPQKKYNIGTFGIFKEGLLFGSNDNTYMTGNINGLLFDNEGNLNYQLKTLKNFLIDDIKSDGEYYYAGTRNSVNTQIGLFKIKKDFSEFSNIGLKANTRRVLPFKNKIYTGGTVHGCYVVNKDGSGLIQILGDGYTGPYIDDLKANSNNVFILSRGQLFSVDYMSNKASQIIYGLRPSSIEVDDERIYASSSYQFYHLSFDGKVSNLKNFPNNINFIKKYKDYIFVVESNQYTINFWISNNKGLTFNKSNYSMPAAYQVLSLELIGENPMTVFINTNGYGLYKGTFTWNFNDQNIFSPPFKIGTPEDLLDKITSYFDHKYPFLGNKIEDQADSETTLNFQGKELPTPYMYYSSHDGTDYGLDLKTPIYSVGPGLASYFYQEKGLGHAIMISHPNGYITVYGHLSSENLATQTSKNVLVNEKIGEVGMSGNTNGPHLHFTVYKGNKTLENKVDPYGWQSQKPDPWEATGAVSKYLWKDKHVPSSIQLNTINLNSIDYKNLKISNSVDLTNPPINLEINKEAPIYDQKNFLYKQGTSYGFRLTNFVGENFLNPTQFLIEYKGFNSFEDEKNYSIWTFSEGKFQKQETIFNPNSNTLISNVNLNEKSILILKNNYKKIKTSNTYKIN